MTTASTYSPSGSVVVGDATSLPRAGVLRMDETVDQSTGPHPWEREAAAGELELPSPAPRPKNVVALADAPVIMEGTVQILGATGGSVRTGLNTFVAVGGNEVRPPLPRGGGGDLRRPRGVGHVPRRGASSMKCAPATRSRGGLAPACRTGSSPQPGG